MGRRRKMKKSIKGWCLRLSCHHEVTDEVKLQIVSRELQHLPCAHPGANIESPGSAIRRTTRCWVLHSIVSSFRTSDFDTSLRSRNILTRNPILTHLQLRPHGPRLSSLGVHRPVAYQHVYKPPRAGCRLSPDHDFEQDRNGTPKGEETVQRVGAHATTKSTAQDWKTWRIRLWWTVSSVMCALTS